MQQRLQQLIARRSVAIVWTIFIFILMAIPGKMLPSEETTFIPNLDKLVHLTLFGGFVFLWAYYLWAKAGKVSIPHTLIIALAMISSLYGIASEYMQKYIIPNRDYSVFDIIADISGAVLGGILVEVVMARRISGKPRDGAGGR